MSNAVVTKLKLENYDTWKSHYDQGEAMRREYRVRGVTVLRDTTDPNIVTIVTRFDSIDDARKMLTSDQWKQAAQRGAPPIEVSFTTVADERTY